MAKSNKNTTKNNKKKNINNNNIDNINTNINNNSNSKLEKTENSSQNNTKNNNSNKKAVQNTDNNISDISRVSSKADLEASEEATSTFSKLDEEEHEKTPTIAQRLMRMFEKMGDLFFLNIYFTVSCIPIITIGAAFTALYSVTNKMVDNREGTITSEYWNAFKSNFKQGTIIWLIDLFIMVAMYFEYIYVIIYDNSLSKFLLVFVGFQFFLLAFAIPLQFPLLARYENTTARIMLNSLALAFSNLGVWFKLFFIWALPVALYYASYKVMVYTWFLWGLILTALFAYFCSMFLVTFYAKIEGAQEANQNDNDNEGLEAEQENEA